MKGLAYNQRQQNKRQTSWLGSKISFPHFRWDRSMTRKARSGTSLLIQWPFALQKIWSQCILLKRKDFGKCCLVLTHSTNCLGGNIFRVLLSQHCMLPLDKKFRSKLIMPLPQQTCGQATLQSHTWVLAFTLWTVTGNYTVIVSKPCTPHKITQLTI